MESGFTCTVEPGFICTVEPGFTCTVQPGFTCRVGPGFTFTVEPGLTVQWCGLLPGLGGGAPPVCSPAVTGAWELGSTSENASLASCNPVLYVPGGQVGTPGGRGLNGAWHLEMHPVGPGWGGRYPGCQCGTVWPSVA